MRSAVLLIVGFLVFGLLPASPVQAQTAPAGQEAKILAMTRANWVHFRDYDGRQLIYFTHLEAWKCGIAKVRYSLNSDTLDREWKLGPCDASAPHDINTLPYVSLPLGTARAITVQLTFKDGSKSEVVHMAATNKLLD